MLRCLCKEKNEKFETNLGTIELVLQNDKLCLAKICYIMMQKVIYFDFIYCIDRNLIFKENIKHQKQPN